MKKIYLLMAACAMLLVMGSCGNGQNQSQNQKEDNDTDLVFISFDLAFFELQGHVKSCNDVVAPNGKYFECVEYDRSGRIIAVDGYNPFEIEEPWSELNEETSTMEDYCKWSRNDQGQISFFDCDWSFTTFTWTEGLLTSAVGSHEDLMYRYEFEYDGKGHLMKQTVYSGTDEEMEADAMFLERVSEYTYLEFDSHGNWTRRMEKYTNYEIDYEDQEEATRSIVYYE